MKPKNSENKSWLPNYKIIGFIGLIVILVALSLFITSFLSTDTIQEPRPDIALTASLENSQIQSNETTNLIVNARNVGDIALNGYLRFETDDQNSFFLETTNAQRLQLNLLTRESIERVFNVRAKTNAHTTIHEIRVYLEDENSTEIASSSTLLTVYRD